jgi:hypothetical protein
MTYSHFDLPSSNNILNRFFHQNMEIICPLESTQSQHWLRNMSWNRCPTHLGIRDRTISQRSNPEAQARTQATSPSL